ncbi:hypothetical protein [Reichenbachiella versicolor]|uniref:hypothetical protein n=1 Tax=Reichenbachiella versicolor TaxID=1821036 RepID=UPI000D6EABF2|nr:hypothetical protein [Reichenbachiella versicolor]
MRVIIILFFALLISKGRLFGQESKIAKEQLEAYCKTTIQLDSLSTIFEYQLINTIYNAPLLNKGEVYNKIKKGDCSEVSNEQKTIYKDILLEIDSMKSIYKKEYVKIIKNAVGLSQFNKIRHQLYSDSSLNVQYDALITELSSGS